METRFYLDIRTGKTGRGIPLKLVIASGRRTSYLSLGIQLQSADQWDEKKSIVNDNHPQAHIINKRLLMYKTQVDEILLRIEIGREVDPNDVTAVKQRIEQELFQKEPRHPKEDRSLFMAWYRKFMNRHTPQTKRLYEVTERRLIAFKPKEIEKVKFDDINIEWLRDFDAFLSTTAPSVNARNIHLRNIRAAFNDAIDCEVTTNYPFRRMKLRPKATRKRSFKVDVLRTIFNVDYLDAWQQKYLDMFKLIFCLCGINIVDLCHLKGIEDGRIEYDRAKTHRHYSIKVEPEAIALIEKLKGKDWLVYPMDQYANYRNYYMNFCTGLRAIKDLINKKESTVTLSALTTYWARHTWATIASSIDIPKDTIAHALGHGNNTVTDIYIDFDQNKVDEANRKVLDWVFHGIDWRNPPVEESKKKRDRPKKK